MPMVNKIRIYRHIALFVVILVSFVLFQLFILYPRSIIYDIKSYDKNTLTLNINNRNHRDLRIKWTIRNRSDEITQRAVIQRRGRIDLVIKDVKGYTSIKDNYGSRVSYHL